LEAGSGFGVGFTRGVLFWLFLELVLSTVPGMGRLSFDVAQLLKANAPLNNNIDK